MTDLPSSIGRYEIRSELGSGMMGVVYEAHDPVLGREIALKVIRLAFNVTEDDRQGFQKRFFAEARTAARLSHPGIVVVHDVGQDEAIGALFMALELLRGRTLDQIIKERAPIEWRESLRIVRLVAEALHHAHSQGVIHRDIKPANIMLLSSGEPKIMDFGIAKVETSQLTAAGQFFGTPLYMSPEQALANPVDGRSDLFSLGSVLYEMLTGRPAFAAENVTKILFQVVSREPQPATELLPTLPDDVEYILSRCLAKDLGRRYPDGRSLAEDIEYVLAGRPPRGRGTWQAPAPVAGTLVAPPPAEPEDQPWRDAAAAHASLDSALEALVTSPPQRAKAVSVARPTTRPAAPARAAIRPAAQAQHTKPKNAALLAVVGAVVVALGVGAVYFVARGPAPQAAPPTTLPPLSLLPTSAPGGADATPQEPTPGPEAASPPQAEAASPPQEVAEPAPMPTPTPTPASAPPAGAPTSAPAAATNAAAPSKPARLGIDFEHSLKSGTLRVWVDEERVIEEQLDSRAKKIVGIRFRKGGFSDSLELAPGRHEVRVEVAWEDNLKTETIWGNFKAGATRRLKAKLGGFVGTGLKKNLDLEWQ